MGYLNSHLLGDPMLGNPLCLILWFGEKSLPLRRKNLVCLCAFCFEIVYIYQLFGVAIGFGMFGAGASASVSVSSSYGSCIMLTH